MLNCKHNFRNYKHILDPYSKVFSSNITENTFLIHYILINLAKIFLAAAILITRFCNSMKPVKTWNSLLLMKIVNRPKIHIQFILFFKRIQSLKGTFAKWEEISISNLHMCCLEKLFIKKGNVCFKLNVSSFFWLKVYGKIIS